MYISEIHFFEWVTNMQRIKLNVCYKMLNVDGR